MALPKTLLLKTTKIADFVLAGGGAAAALVALYILYHYVWIGDRSFTGLAGELLYLLIPASVCVLLLISIRLRQPYKLAVAFLLSAALISACGAEMILRREVPDISELPYWAFGPGLEQKRNVLMLAKEAGADFDTRDLPSVTDEVRKQGIDAVPFVGAGFMEKQPDGSFRSGLELNYAEFIPLGGISDKLTIVCGETGTFTSYKSDERGFNNPHGIWSSQHVEIAALGQSFIQGFCAPEGQNFVDLVRKHYPSTLNLGFSGEGPLMQLGAISEYLTSLRPKRVLWFYLEGIDLGDLQNERKSGLAMRYIKDDFKQGLMSRQSDIDRALTSYTEKVMHQRKVGHLQGPSNNTWETLVDAVKFSRLRQKLGWVYGEDPSILSQLDKPNIELFGEILARASRRVGKWGGRLDLVYLPSWKRFGSRSPLPDQERALVYAAARASNVAIIDTLGGFYAQEDPLSLFPFRVFGHYNEAGHQVVAAEVLKAIHK